MIPNLSSPKAGSTRKGWSFRWPKGPSGRSKEVSFNFGPRHTNMPKDRRPAVFKVKYKFNCALPSLYGRLPPMASQMKDKDVGLAGLQHKLAMKQDQHLAQYPPHYAGPLKHLAKSSRVKYIATLEQAKVEHPHSPYEMGAVAMNSCSNWGPLLPATGNCRSPRLLLH